MAEQLRSLVSIEDLVLSTHTTAHSNFSPGDPARQAVHMYTCWQKLKHIKISLKKSKDKTLNIFF